MFIIKLGYQHGYYIALILQTGTYFGSLDALQKIRAIRVLIFSYNTLARINFFA